MLSSAQLAAFQAAANMAMDETIVIKRATPTSDGMGGSSQVWNTVTTVSGNLSQPTGAQMQNYGYVIGSLDTWQVRVPVGTNLLENDRLVVGGQTLRVQVILQPQSYQTSMRLLASEVKDDGEN